jgi:hypothetical protein
VDVGVKDAYVLNRFSWLLIDLNVRLYEHNYESSSKIKTEFMEQLSIISSFQER